MGIFVGSVDFWELGSVALGTFGVAKGKRRIWDGRIKQENSAEISIAKIP